MTRIEEQLILHEGLKLKAYTDTVGKLTIGVGYNVTDRGWDVLEQTIGRKVDRARPEITKDEALAVLRVDIARVERAVRTCWPHFATLDEVRQRVAVDMAFNLGYTALQFKQTIKAIESRDWSLAAKRMYQSKWARQVDDGAGGRFGRADRLAGMMLTGKDYTQ